MSNLGSYVQCCRFSELVSFRSFYQDFHALLVDLDIFSQEVEVSEEMSGAGGSVLTDTYT